MVPSGLQPHLTLVVLLSNMSLWLSLSASNTVVFLLSQGLCVCVPLLGILFTLSSLYPSFQL